MSVTVPMDGPWLDEAAGRLIRPYTVSGGRTRPTAELDLMSLVMATGAASQMYFGPEHSEALGLCQGPTSVAEIAGHLRLPAVVTKILLSDLMDSGAVSVRPPHNFDNPSDCSLLEAVLDGLRRQL